MMNLTVKELRGIAKDNGLKGYSKLRKAELVELLTANGVKLNAESNDTEQIVEEEVVIDSYTACSKDWTDEQLAKYLGLDDKSESESTEEEEFFDEKLGIHVTKDMVGVEEDIDDEDSTTAPDNCNENKTFEDVMLAWEKEEAEYKETYGNKANEVFASEQEARYSEEAMTFDEELDELAEVAKPRTYAEIMADKAKDKAADEVVIDRVQAKNKKDIDFYNENSSKITAENIGNTHIVSGGQAKYLHDLFLTFKITIKDDIKTAEKASDKLNAINRALAEGKLTKRKCTVLTKNRPTKAQLQVIINKQRYVNIMDLPKTKAEAGKLISNLNKKEFLEKKKVEKEIAVTAVNEKVVTLTKAKENDRGGFKSAIKKFFSRLFN